VVGVIKIREFLRKRFEPKNFFAEDFFNERVGVRAVSITLLYNTCPTPPVRVL
jgi:hypothetical protein